jgi:hypothetical protein
MLTQDEPAQPCFSSGRIETQYGLIGLYMLAFANEDIANDAAFEMLDLLVLSGCDKRSGDDDGTFERSNRRPDAKAAKAKKKDRNADPDRLAAVARHILVPLIDAGAGTHDVPPPEIILLRQLWQMGL